ncbi:MAG TPA: acyltransferase family protein [Caulobacteraceae bacterium]|nr:acyltransferase family protein [Caulobacteraceae bacterium]
MSTFETGAAPERLHALDAVRGLALMLGIVFHASISFLPSRIPVWIVMDNDRSIALAVLFHVLHAFRMTTFFLIAGFFAHMMLQRRGTKGFIADRLKRIGIPLVAGWPILFGLILAATIWAAMRTAAATHTPLPPAPVYPGFPAFPLTHLWFLYLLLLFYAGALALRAVVRALDRDGRMEAASDRIVAALCGSVLAPFALAAPLALALSVQPEWPAWFGIPTPDASLLPNTPALVGFGSAFAFGWLVQRQPRLIEAWRDRWLLNLALFAAATAAGFAITGVAPLVGYAPRDWTTPALAGLCALSAWSGTFAVIGLALRFLSGHSPARRYVADASYWLYLIHLPLVLALQVALAQLAWPWWVKFPLILAIAFPLMFASYEFMVRHSWIGALLNGRKHPWPAKRVAAQTQLPSATRQESAQ